MQGSFIETQYPIGFRENEAKQLGEFIHLRHSVELVGMKRVGISDFLRFFLNRPDIINTYVNHNEKHIFIPIDLNYLHEIDLFPFWILTLKRIADVVQNSDIVDNVKTKISHLFTNSIQSRDLFITIENLRESLASLVSNDMLPTLFFLRFDRLKDIVNTDFFANLQGLKDATGHSVSYVFTSYRTLEELFPSVFLRKNQIAFSHPFFLKPAKKNDFRIIFKMLQKKYNMDLDAEVSERLLALSGGHIQFLRLSFIVLNQINKKISALALERKLLSDEQINLQSEELLESLNEEEQFVLKKVIANEKLSVDDFMRGKYLFDTGMVIKDNDIYCIFSPLFASYIKLQEIVEKNITVFEFTKKEKMLHALLLQNINAVCERDIIIQHIWPEYEDYGVSDWTIDKLVARLRNKLKKQNSLHKIVTVKTRGYKLVSKA